MLDGLLATKGQLTSCTYQLTHHGAKTAIDAQARLGPDWFFARAWFDVVPSTKSLYTCVDRLKARGFRESTGRQPAVHAQEPEQTVPASTLLAGLSAEERQIHRELFPEEHALLAAGYDWDRNHVYLGGQPLKEDDLGRIMESSNGWLFEWVFVQDERTWRRYPIQRLENAMVKA